MTRFSRSLALSAVLFSIAPMAFSQSQSINGTIRGQITDPTGAPVPNTAITIKIWIRATHAN